MFHDANTIGHQEIDQVIDHATHDYDNAANAEGDPEAVMYFANIVLNHCDRALHCEDYSIAYHAKMMVAVCWNAWFGA